MQVHNKADTPFIGPACPRHSRTVRRLGVRDDDAAQALRRDGVYEYLTRQGAALNSPEKGTTSPADYYAAQGETPGQWVGSGVLGLDGVEAGDTVTAEQMRHLFGTGARPLTGQPSGRRTRSTSAGRCPHPQGGCGAARVLALGRLRVGRSTAGPQGHWAGERGCMVAAGHTCCMVEVDPERFEVMVSEALDGIPVELGEHMSNVAVTVQHDSGPAGLLGLYQGVPLTSRTTFYAGALPDRITIYRRAICAVCNSDSEVVKQVRRTVIHEVGHHFGIGDARLHELGW